MIEGTKSHLENLYTAEELSLRRQVSMLEDEVERLTIENERLKKHVELITKQRDEWKVTALEATK